MPYTQTALKTYILIYIHTYIHKQTHSTKTEGSASHRHPPGADAARHPCLLPASPQPDVTRLDAPKLRAAPQRCPRPPSSSHRAATSPSQLHCCNGDRRPGLTAVSRLLLRGIPAPPESSPRPPPLPPAGGAPRRARRVPSAPVESFRHRRALGLRRHPRPSARSGRAGAEGSPGPRRAGGGGRGAGGGGGCEGATWRLRVNFPPPAAPPLPAQWTRERSRGGAGAGRPPAAVLRAAAAPPKGPTQSRRAAAPTAATSTVRAGPCARRRAGGGCEGRGAPAAPIVLPEAAPAPPAPSLPAAGAPSAGGPGEVASPARRRRRQQRGLPGGAPAPPRGAGLGQRRGRSPLPFLPPLCVADVGMRVGAEYQARIPDFEPGKIAFFFLIIYFPFSCLLFFFIFLFFPPPSVCRDARGAGLGGMRGVGRVCDFPPALCICPG